MVELAAGLVLFWHIVLLTYAIDHKSEADKWKDFVTEWRDVPVSEE